MPGRIRPAAQVVAAVLALTLAGGCSLAGRTFGGYVDDKALVGAVKLRLAREHLSHLTRVNVDVFEGTVYLSGTVDTPQQKSDAEIAARRAKGVELVVNDLVVRGQEPVSALPDQRWGRSLLDRLGGAARVEADQPGGPGLAYDTEGHHVATVYMVSQAALLDSGVDALRAGGRPIDHVSIYPVLDRRDLPGPHFYVVLWHVADTTARR